MTSYDAFISYSHAKDKPIAAALQSVVQKLGKPWKVRKRRSLRVFRDDTSLSATPQLWPSIEQALGQSRFLILLASPEAAGVLWVEGGDLLARAQEQRHAPDCADRRRALLGRCNRRFRLARKQAAPPVLYRVPDRPKWVDLRGYRIGVTKRDAKFMELSADFAAAIHGLPKEDLLSQEMRQQRRALTLAWSAASLLFVLAGAAGWQWNAAVEQEKSQRQAQRDRPEKTLAMATHRQHARVPRLYDLRGRQGMPVDLVRKITRPCPGPATAALRIGRDHARIAAQRGRRVDRNEDHPYEPGGHQRRIRGGRFGSKDRRGSVGCLSGKCHCATRHLSHL